MPKQHFLIAMDIRVHFTDGPIALCCPWWIQCLHSANRRYFALYAYSLYGHSICHRLNSCYFVHVRWAQAALDSLPSTVACHMRNKSHNQLQSKQQTESTYWYRVETSNTNSWICWALEGMARLALWNLNQSQVLVDAPAPDRIWS